VLYKLLLKRIYTPRFINELIFRLFGKFESNLYVPNNLITIMDAESIDREECESVKPPSSHPASIWAQGVLIDFSQALS